VQVDGRVGFEAAVSAATGELRVGVAVERDAAAGLRRAIGVLRGEVTGLDSREATARMQAERDAARTLAARQATEMAALQQVVGALRRDLAAAAAERDALLPASDAFAAAGSSLLWRNGDALFDDAACGLWLRLQGFPAGSQPAGITWGIATVPADRLSCGPSPAGGSVPLHPGCRLMYPPNAVAGANIFYTNSGNSWAPGEWVCVDLGGERTVAGALVQGDENSAASTEGSNRWHRHKFQWSADGATWADVDGGRVWNRDGLARKDVSAAVFGAPVRCRYLRIVAVSNSGFLRWEVVVLP
jgi:hypothetical protein